MTKILVVVKLVPDLVEALEIDASGRALDTTWLRQIINEFDEHALEQAILLKETHGCHVTVLGPQMEGIDEILFTASARGADELIRLDGFERWENNHALARAAVEVVRNVQPDLILTGVQAHDDLDGALGALMAELLDWPYSGYIAGVQLDNGTALARKEHPGGWASEWRVKLPAVLGIQAAESPPRYVAVSRVRQAMSLAAIESRRATHLDPTGCLPVQRMLIPQMTSHAQMLPPDEEAAAHQIVEILRSSGVVKGGEQ